jgi:hypothetical protein
VNFREAGEFGFDRLAMMLQFGEYEVTVDDNSTWSEGDWNGDGDFTTTDLILAFQSGSYQQAAIPLPLGSSNNGAPEQDRALRRKRPNDIERLDEMFASVDDLRFEI